MFRFFRLFILILVISLSGEVNANSFTIKENSPYNITSRFQEAGIKIDTIDIKADNWIIYDSISKQIINGKNINKKIDIGNFTSLMLIYMIFNEIKSSKLTLNYIFKLPVEKQKEILQQIKSPLVLNIKQDLVLADVILSSLINNSLETNLILEYLLAKNNSIIQAMNLEAERLGLKETHFNNILGEEQVLHYTTSHDLVKLLDNLITQYPNQLRLFTQKNFNYNNINYANKNQIFLIDNLIDISLASKTNNNISMLSSKQRIENNITKQPRRIITLVTNVKNSELSIQSTLAMLNHGFADFDTIKIYDEKHTIGEFKLWLGKKDKIKLGIKDSVYLTIPKGFATRLNTVIDKPKYIYAPIQEGTKIANIKWIYDKYELYSIPVISLESIHEANFFSRWIDKLRILADY